MQFLPLDQGLDMDPAAYQDGPIIIFFGCAILLRVNQTDALPYRLPKKHLLGIDLIGLDRQDRRYLETRIRVFSGGPVGLEAMAHTMSVSSDTLEDEVEPFLL
jgi:hypothetical protein